MKLVFFLLALLSLGLGIVGIFIPGLPTTIFIILAAWFASRSSPKLLFWIENHRWFGPNLKNWRTHGAVSRRAKWSATVMMALGGGILAWAHTNWYLVGALWAIMATVAIWLWRRPEGPRHPGPDVKP